MLWRGWPVARSGRRVVRLVAGNALVLGGAGLAYGLTRGVDPGAVSAAAGCVVAAGLLYGMLFEGFLRDRLPAATERAVLLGLTVVTAPSSTWRCAGTPGRWPGPAARRTSG